MAAYHAFAMSIRWKLLIILLAVSLAPLAAVFLFSHDAARSLGVDLAAGTRDRLATDAERFLLKSVREQAKLLRVNAQLLEQNLHIQAREAERRLAMPPDDSEIHFCTEFEAEDSSLNLVTTEKHQRVDEDGTTTPIPVSYEHASILPPAGANLEDIRVDAERLSAMTPAFKLVLESQKNFIQWQYVALASGLHCAYPGHGFYPAGYDPPQRPWYRNAMAKDGPAWNKPLVDAATQQITLTVSTPIRGPEGRIAGVTAIDVRMTDLVREVELPEDWADVARTMLIVPVDKGDAGKRGLMIIAERFFSGQRSWNVPLKPPFVRSDETAQVDAIFDDVVAERAVVRRMPFEGRASICAYGPLSGAEAALLTIVPEENVLGPARAAEQTVRQRLKQHRTLVLSIVAGVLVAVVALALLLSRAITQPVSELALTAQRIADGDLEARADVTSRDEIGALGATFNDMTPKLRDRLRMRESLAVAMEVQQCLLPDGPPNIPGLDVAGRSIYCDETGGDYYDFVDLSRINPHTLGVALGDVTGHGIAAALLMATGRALLRSRLDHASGLDDLMNHLNRHLAEDAPVGKFMTLAYLLFDSQNKTVRWASGGHDPALVYSPETDEFSELEGGGLALGIEGSWEYEQYGPRTLESGDVVVVGTDGIWEASNDARDMFGKERLCEVIRRHGRESARSISEAITDAVAEFREGYAQEDDITLVVVRIE